MKSHKLSFLLFAVFLMGCQKASRNDDRPATIETSVRANQTIPGYPHTIDYYIPDNAESAVIFLHGGGGKKERFAANLEIKSNNTNSNYEILDSGKEWLINKKVMAVFPQGQTIAGTNFAFTWNNYVMDSGVNDMAFLQALVASIQSDLSLPQITKFYLVGHSNGGMMVNRMWCESPGTFDGFGALAGPPSTELSASGAYPCTPTVIRPYIGIVGDADTGLNTAGNMSSLSWTLASYNGASPAWVASTVINDKEYHASRVTMACGGAVATPNTSGQLTTYSDCSGVLKLIVISQSIINGAPSGGDHCLVDTNGSCVTTLAGETGVDYKSVLIDFLMN